MLFWWGEINGSRRHLWCIFPRCLSDCECLVSLQRPVQWTMAAAIAHVMIRWQESAAAVLLASLCSRTARPVKVKHHHSKRQLLSNQPAACCIASHIGASVSTWSSQELLSSWLRCTTLPSSSSLSFARASSTEATWMLQHFLFIMSNKINLRL